MAARFFAPLLVSGVENPEKGTVALHVTSDLPAPAAGRLRWTLTTAAGTRVMAGEKPVHIPPNKSARAAVLNLMPSLRKYGPRNLILWLELSVKNRPVSHNMVTFARPKHLELARPRFTATVRPLTNNAFHVTLNTNRPALWVWLESAADATYSDNFFHLRPGRPAAVTVTPARTMTAAEFRKTLAIHSLAGIYA